MIRGSCLWGAIRFQLSAVVGPFELCHCSRCRKVSGSAFFAAVGVRASDFRLLSGRELITTYEAPILESPPPYRSSFGSRCGSPVPCPPAGYAWFEMPAGLLEDDPGMTPDLHIFTELKAPWFEIADDLPRLDKQALRELRLGGSAGGKNRRVAEARSPDMKRWQEFASAMPAMAQAGHALIYRHRVGLGYLATIRKNGGPRVHPVCPVIASGGLYVFIGNHSPKVRDLLRDGRYALHSFPMPEVDDEFYVAGRASRVDDAEVRDVVYQAYTATGAFTSDDTLFELWLERALHAKYERRPSWPPAYTKWSAE